MKSLEQLREYFSNDRYATETTGIEILEAEDGYAKVGLEVREGHMNAGNRVMGAVYYTMADFAFAVAANQGKLTTVSTNSSISFLGVAKGKKLIAEGKTIKSGRSTCTVSVDVHDELGTQVAYAVFTGMRIR